MRQQVEREQYGYISLDMIRQWCEVAQDQPLFESNVRFQNYPIDEPLLQQWGSHLTIDDVRIVDGWHYPLHLIVIPQAKLSLSITYDSLSFDSKMIAQLLEDLQTLLAAVATDPQQRLETLRCTISQSG